jgi:hypothetical protein
MVEIWMNTMNLADEENVSPWDALLIAVKRRSARVRWCDSVVQHIIDEHRKRCLLEGEGDPDVPPDDARKWLTESRNEERLMTRAAKMAVDAGVADAMIRRVEREGQLMADAMFAALDTLDLSHEQRMMALNKMQEIIAKTLPTPIADQSQPKIIEQAPPLDEDGDGTT